MPDLALAWSPYVGAADLVLADNDLGTDAGLRTAILLSLFLDAPIEAGDPAPDSTSDRGGWWGDAFQDVEGDHIGSRLWLLSRATNGRTTAQRARQYAEQALAWLVEDKIARQVTVTVEQERELLVAAVTVERPTGQALTFRFDALWAGERDAL